MIGFSNQKGRDIRKPVPGCMGRMINLFDLGSGVSATKLLTDKPHRDGLQITRDLDVENNSDFAVGIIKEKPMAELPKCLSTINKANGTPMKMLMAEELSKEQEAACKQPTVIAKLMGLDAFPAQQQFTQPLKRATQERGVHDGHNNKKLPPHRQGGGFLERVVIPKQQQHPPHHRDPQQRRECKDVYEIRPQIPGSKSLEYAPQSRGKHGYIMNDKRMGLVRQKFMEAKRLATSQNVLQSKEFQDALEVLSSNRDLFLKFLEEPDLMLSQHLRGQQQEQNPTGNRGKRITVLRPMPQTSAGNTARRGRMENDLLHETNRRINNDSCQSSRAGVQQTGSLLPQPTRIVVLKPSPGKNRNDVSREASFPSTTTIRIPKVPVPNEGLVHNEARDAREAAKEITRQMRESLSRRDETLLSHFLSNATTEEEEDEDPFCRSGKEHVEQEEDECTCSSTSHDSWKYREPYGSPYSFSSRSQYYPYLPESSVIREAKRRLSERWVLVTSGGVSQEPQEIQRSSSTLGEMLSIREARKNRDDCRPSGHHHMNLPRSRSVPRSSSGSEKAELDDAKVVHFHSANDSAVDEAVGKTKYQETLSFKGKVSSLFFSRNSKASNTDKSVSYPSSYTDHVTHGSSQSGNSDITVKSYCGTLQCSVDESPKEGPIYNYEELLRKNLYSTNSGSDMGIPDNSKKQESLPLEKLMASEDASDNNLDQPSPVSVLEAQFEDDAISSSSSSLPHANVTQEHHPRAGVSPRRLSVEPVPCSLAWDDDDDNADYRDDIHKSRTHLKPIAIKNSILEDEQEEKEAEEWLAFARLLLSSSILDGETWIAVTRWHSLDSPLDPSLLGTFLEPKEEEDLAKFRVRRSNQRLLFDCVNAAILDVSRNNLLDSCPWPWPVSGRPTTSLGKPAAAAAACVAEEVVLGAVRSLLSDSKERRHLPPPNGSSTGGNLWGDDSSKSSVVADLIIREEILGKGWEEEMVEVEVLEMVVEIQGQVVEELVADALCCWF